MVLQKLQGLDPSKSPGPDQLYPSVLSSCTDCLCNPLYLIYVLTVTIIWSISWCLETCSCYSYSQKRFQKTIDQLALCTSVCCKILESFIQEAMSRFLIHNELLICHQHGFSVGKLIYWRWTSALDNGFTIDVLFLDYNLALSLIVGSWRSYVYSYGF